MTESTGGKRAVSVFALFGALAPLLVLIASAFIWVGLQSGELERLRHDVDKIDRHVDSVRLRVPDIDATLRSIHSRLEELTKSQGKVGEAVEDLRDEIRARP